MSDHFTIAELTLSQIATRNGIDNTPPTPIMAELGRTVNQLEVVRSFLGHPMHVNSGYRCEELEKILCHKDYAAWCNNHQLVVSNASWRTYFITKAHPQGFAVDFTCDGFGTPTEIVAALAKSGIKFDQLIEEGTWVHISFSPLMRGQVLTAKFDSTGTPSYAKRD